MYRKKMIIIFLTLMYSWLPTIWDNIDTFFGALIYHPTDTVKEYSGKIMRHCYFDDTWAGIFTNPPRLFIRTLTCLTLNGDTDLYLNAGDGTIYGKAGADIPSDKPIDPKDERLQGDDIHIHKNNIIMFKDVTIKPLLLTMDHLKELEEALDKLLTNMSHYTAEQFLDAINKVANFRDYINYDYAVNVAPLDFTNNVHNPSFNPETDTFKPGINGIYEVVIHGKKVLIEVKEQNMKQFVANNTVALFNVYEMYRVVTEVDESVMKSAHYKVLMRLKFVQTGNPIYYIPFTELEEMYLRQRSIWLGGAAYQCYLMPFFVAMSHELGCTWW